MNTLNNSQALKIAQKFNALLKEESGSFKFFLDNMNIAWSLEDYLDKYNFENCSVNA